jgi:hypothetical protein
VSVSVSVPTNEEFRESGASSVLSYRTIRDA